MKKKIFVENENFKINVFIPIDLGENYSQYHKYLIILRAVKTNNHNNTVNGTY